MVKEAGSVVISNLSIADTETSTWEKKAGFLLKEYAYMGAEIENFTPSVIDSNVQLNPVEEILIYTAAALSNRWVLSIDEQEWDSLIRKQMFND